MTALSVRRLLTRPIALLLVPLVAGATYGGAWAMQGYAPFFGQAACPPGSTSASPTESPVSPSASPTTEGSGDLSLDFGFRPEPLQPHASVSWSFAVTNTSDAPVTLTFPSGQDGDVTLSKGSDEVYRWSADRSFTQALREVELAAGDTHNFSLDDTLDLEAGSYQARAWVTSDPAPSPVTATVEIGAPTPTQSPTQTPTEEPSTTPTPTPSPTTSPTATTSPRLQARPRRRARRGRPRALLCAAAFTLALWSWPMSIALAQEGGSGGKNVVIVVNETDGRAAARSGVLVGHADGTSVVPENLASARASCTDCRTVAVAIQAVLITTTGADYVSPRNVAVAVNSGCTRCRTFAYAWQYVITTGEQVRITPEGQQRIADARAEADRLARSDLSFPELDDRLDAVAAEVRAVLDEEVTPVGPRTNPDRKLDVATTC